jgi:hypothetical protein
MQLFCQILGAALIVIFALVIIALLLSVPVWLLWNWVAVAVLGLKEITLMQALGLSLLSAILFKSSSISTKSNSKS